ncbi:ribosome small subunit-dependent GTPase A [Pseudoramibacter porci]|jgi:ribosome biogenesis GTPase|uniref:Small ribosomal subunit biogenesis GTPase RsgA n=1 Tax=Pseudoramibacter porci TaxID=2606631 RepID=A0A7X2NG97_9FIRM|nr:ribosome small subunit-dependent GTPase A [Pseudoramibacter porci]MSS20071.1 ribosome small subunit-dependent GTPase A [Pseudoramibacter porci]
MQHQYKQISPISGRIVKGIGGFYTVVDAAGMAYTAKPAGILRHRRLTPMVGDYVQIEKDDNQDGEYTLTDIQPRKNELVRPPVSNVDVGIIVAALRDPAPNGFLIDEMLVSCEAQGIEPVLVFTKRDLARPEDIKGVADYQATPYPVILSEPDQWEKAAGELGRIIAGRSAFLAGPSGVGKSTLTNALLGDDVMATGGLSKKLGRGRHTTRHVELLALPQGGWLLDTPGFSALNIGKQVQTEQLADCFPEFPKGQCKFNDCRHQKEPGCAVREGVEAGRISQNRYDHYIQMFETLRKQKKYG